MHLIIFLLRPLYYLLYHQFAWTYDIVAAVVSLGRWQEWIHIARPYLHGRILEIGYGPGHFQQSLVENGLPAFGLDESRQMAYQARRRLRKQASISRLSVGYAQFLPFTVECFDTVVATFPAEFIFDPRTLIEIRRVLVPSGRLIILPMAWITGKRPLERLAACLFRVTGEVPGKPGPIATALKDRFANLGFEVHSEIVELIGSQVLVIVATVSKPIDFHQLVDKIER